MSAPCIAEPRQPTAPAGSLIITIPPGAVRVQHTGLTERQGLASRELADALRAELDALAAAAQRLGGRR